MSSTLRRRGQTLVEFALTIGLLMLLVVATAQVAIYLHYGTVSPSPVGRARSRRPSPVTP
jgi:hypothetical protein